MSDSTHEQRRTASDTSLDGSRALGTAEGRLDVLQHAPRPSNPQQGNAGKQVHDQSPQDLEYQDVGRQQGDVFMSSSESLGGTIRSTVVEDVSERQVLGDSGRYSGSKSDTADASQPAFTSADADVDAVPDSPKPQPNQPKPKPKPTQPKPIPGDTSPSRH